MMDCDHAWIYRPHSYEHSCIECSATVRLEDAYIVGLSFLHDFGSLSNESISKLFEEINGLRS